MAANLGAEMATKIELINKKIEEINQRRYGLKMTRVEDELDKQELDEYIGSLHLTSEQKSLIDGFSKENGHAVQNQNIVYYGMMIVSVFIEAYLGYAIAELLLTPAASTGNNLFDTLYLYLMIAVFIINGFYVLKYMRILK